MDGAGQGHEEAAAAGAGQNNNKRQVGPRGDNEYYPPISDNRYKGLIYWWTFGELRADPDQLSRYVSTW